MSHKPFEDAGQLEAVTSPAPPLQRLRTAGGHLEDTTQPGLPVVHRSFANPAPLAILSLATSVFLISSFGVHARGVTTPNVMVGVLIFFGGACQFIAGIMEFVSGNTFGATVFPSFGALNMAYGMIYLPGSGIIDAYIDAKTGALDPSFPQALSVFLWAWFILSVGFTFGAVRSSWVLLLDFVAVDFFFLLLACGYMVDSVPLQQAGYAFGFVVVVFSYWVGLAGLYAGGTTPFNVPVFRLHDENNNNIHS